jgi:hypothetical protein
MSTRIGKINAAIELLQEAKYSQLNTEPIPNIMYEELEDANILIVSLMEDVDKQITADLFAWKSTPKTSQRRKRTA